MANRQNLFISLLIEAQDRASRQLRTLNNSIKAVGVSIAAYFTASAVGGFFTSAVKGAADLQAELSKLASKTGATASEIARLKAAAEALGASDTLNVSATEAAEAMTQLGAAGQNTEQILSSIEPVLAMAQGAALEFGDAAGIVTANLAGFNLQADQSGRVADVLTKGANSAKTTVRELADALSYAAPSANAAGMAIEETTAIIAKMQNAGIDGTRAGTALNAMLSALANPASTASKALDAAGIKSRSFVDVLAALERGGAGAEAAILSFGTEAGPALRALLTQGAGSVRDLKTQLDNASGSAMTAAATMGDNLKGAMSALGSVWDALKQKIGDPLLEPITREVRALAQAISEFSASQAFEQMRAGFVAAFEAMAAAIRAFLSTVDWAALGQSIADFAGRAKQSLDEFTANIRAVSETVAFFASAVGTGLATIEAGFFGLAGVVATVASKIVDGFAIILKAQSRLTFGPLRTALESTSADVKRLSDSLATAAEVNFSKAGDALDRAADRSIGVRRAFGLIEAPARQAAAASDQVATSMTRTAAESASVAAALERVENAQQAYDQAMQDAVDGSSDASAQIAALSAELETAKAAFERVTAAQDQSAQAAQQSASAYVTYGQWVKRSGDEAAASIATQRDLATAVGEQSEQVKALSFALAEAEAKNAKLSSGTDVFGAEALARQLEDAKTESERLKAELESLSGRAVTADVDTTQIDVAIRKTESLDGVTTYSDHEVRDNVPEVLRDIKQLEKNTQSTHTVYIRKVQTNASGGLVLRRASGGAIFRPLAGTTVPGAGDRDTVPRALRVGSYVLKKAAARRYGALVDTLLTPGERVLPPEIVSRVGIGLLERLNGLRVPRFAEGGLVGAAVSGGSDTVNINLQVGTQRIQLQGAREQAQQLATALRGLSRTL